MTIIHNDPKPNACYISKCLRSGRQIVFSPNFFLQNLQVLSVRGTVPSVFVTDMTVKLGHFTTFGCTFWCFRYRAPAVQIADSSDPADQIAIRWINCIHLHHSGRSKLG